jgi:hypothetical protein
MRRPMLGHLDPAFHAILDEITGLLRAVWRMPEGDVLALPATATGTFAMEAGMVNLLEPGDTAIVAEAGFFGRRLADIAERCGANVVRVPAPWGETVPNAALLDALDGHPDTRLIAVVHAETSTSSCCGATGPSAPRSTTTRRRSSRSMRCTRRCASCSRRAWRRAGRATPPPARTCRRRCAPAGWSCSPHRTASSPR